MSRVPEIQSAAIRSKITNGIALVSAEFEEFAKSLAGKKIVDIAGGMGEYAEHLSELGNTVSLMEELRLFFVYRRQVWPDSKVVEMNIHPSNIKYNNTPFNDLAIIHSGEFEELAKRIAKSSYNTSTKEYKVYDEEKPVSSTKRSNKVTKNVSDSGAVEQESTPTVVDIPTE